MGIVKVKIENFRTIDRMNLDVKESGISCLIGKNGVGKTTIINAIRYLYKVAEQPYDIEQIIDKKNSYVQRTKIELVFDFTKLHKKTSNQYIEENLADFEKYIKDNQLPLRMTQYKNGLVEWYPINDVYKVRRLLRVFSVYIVDTRDISLYEWSVLWDVVCDIAISGIEQDSSSVKSNLTSVFREIYGEKYVKVHGIIENIFKEEKITINEKDYKRRFKNAIATNFGGDIFKVNEENIGYYSAGMNSLKYITLFLKLIIELSETAWKDITIIFDEPEISLHPQYIDELADILSSYGVKNTILISTHSTHLVSALIRNCAKIYFYQVYSVSGYARIKQVQDFFDEKDKYLIGDEEAASYFSDAIVFVEGQTEIQLLRNKNIIELYPFLRKITCYNTKSNDSTTRLIMPNQGSAIPFLNIVDMDKILSYSQRTHRFSVKSGNITVNPLGKKENQERELYYFYSQRKRLTYGQRKEISELVKQEFYTDTSNFVLTGNKYTNLISAVKKYCKVYNCIPLRTTIEGSIVCSQSMDIILKWFETSWMSKNYEDFKKVICTYNRSKQEVIIRCILHGKLDNLFNYQEGGKKFVETGVYKVIKDYSTGTKVDGWVLSFFNWFFEHYMNKGEEENRELFARTFPEINEVLQFIKFMVE